MPKNAEPNKWKVVIVGGGCAGLAAAWELAKLRKYDVHLYESSWRLGGKGASGRDEHGRIREHGLHIWLGFYENAFRMMRDCYDEVEAKGWGPNANTKDKRLPHGSIDDAFFAEPHLGVAGPNRANVWEVWSGHLPPMKGRPGEPFDAESNPFTLASYLARCLHLLNTLMVSVVGTPGGDVPGTPRPEERSTSDEAIELDFSYDAARSPKALVERMARMLRGGVLTTAAGALQGVTMLEDWLRTFNLGQTAIADTVLEFIEAVAGQTRKLLRDVVAVDEHIRRKTEVIDIVMTIAVGLYRDRVLFDKRGLDALNGIDYREWLTKHGATKTSVDSPFIKGIYDLVFAYRQGDHKRPALAAGVALRGALRMFFTYRGAMFFRMRSGMGETVFSPLYKVLREGGEVLREDGKIVGPITFHFQHTLSDVEFDFNHSDGARVTSLTFTTKGDRDKLDEISNTKVLDHFGCWPDDDRLFQRAGSKGGSVSLQDGLQGENGFDAVILAMGSDDFVKVCENNGRSKASLFQKYKHWDDMRHDVKTVATKAAQVWLSRDLEQLGWYRGSAIISAMSPPFATGADMTHTLGLPFATWADMTHTLASEQAWRTTLERDEEPTSSEDERSVAYFCSVLADHEIASAASKNEKAEEAKVREAVEKRVEGDLFDLLTDGMRPFWPNAFDDERTSLDDLVSLDKAELGPGKVPGQHHVQANFIGSERYTLSLPGSVEHRVSPLDRSVTNMTIAGDWTACGIDAGCVEAAVMSGMLAAHAITGTEPPLEKIVGYHHP